MKNRLLHSILFGLLLACLTGCVEVDYYIKVNRDASADVEYKLGFDQMFIGLLDLQGESPLDKAIQSAEENGFTVSHYSDEDMSGIIARAHLDSLQEIPPMGSGSVWAEAAPEANRHEDNAESPFKIEPGFFYNRYLLDTQIDLSEMKAGRTGDDYGLGSAFLNKVKMRFRITLPVKPESHNAAHVADNSHTLGWDLLPGQSNRIMLEAAAPNLRNIVITAAGALIILIAAFIAWPALRKKKQSAEL